MLGKVREEGARDLVWEWIGAGSSKDNWRDSTSGKSSVDEIALPELDKEGLDVLMYEGVGDELLNLFTCGFVNNWCGV